MWRHEESKSRSSIIKLYIYIAVHMRVHALVHVHRHRKHASTGELMKESSTTEICFLASSVMTNWHCNWTNHQLYHHLHVIVCMSYISMKALQIIACTLHPDFIPATLLSIQFSRVHAIMCRAFMVTMTIWQACHVDLIIHYNSCTAGKNCLRVSLRKSQLCVSKWKECHKISNVVWKGKYGLQGLIQSIHMLIYTGSDGYSSDITSMSYLIMHIAT